MTVRNLVELINKYPNDRDAEPAYSTEESPIPHPPSQPHLR
jgi:hypothetical protein